jgi:lysophospholipase L1-like esterase
VQYAQQKPPPHHGRFGLAGSAAVAGPHASVLITPGDDTDRHLAASHYSLFYGAEPRGGDLAVRFDDEAAMLLSGRASEHQARYHTFVRPLGWHAIKILSTGDGPVRLFGVSVERDQPGLVIDTLGIRGTRAANMLLWDQEMWASNLQERAPDLVTFAYGTNETTDRGQSIQRYERELRTVLGRLRSALPGVSCVLIGPGDFPRSINKRWMPRPRLLQIIEAQRRAAPDYGCGFWDTYAFMGGAGSMQQWVRARPALGAGDRIHLTVRGYVRMGMVLGDALMRAYDEKHLPQASRVTSRREESLPPMSSLR